MLPVYLRAIDHVFGQNDGWKRLRTLVKELSAAFALAVPRAETEVITPHLAFFQRAVAMIRKRLADDSGGGAGHARQRDIDAAVRQVIGGAVDADEVIDLFAVAGPAEARLDILSDEFLGRVAALEEKNLALETLASCSTTRFASPSARTLSRAASSAKRSKTLCCATRTRRSPLPR